MSAKTRCKAICGKNSNQVVNAKKNDRFPAMKIVVTGRRGIPGIMGGVETHCEELFPRIARKGFDVTVIRRKSYVRDTLSGNTKGITLVGSSKRREKEIARSDRPYVPGQSCKAKTPESRHHPHPRRRPGAADAGRTPAGTERSYSPTTDRITTGTNGARQQKRHSDWVKLMGTRFANEVIVISNVIQRHSEPQIRTAKSVT